MVEESFDTSFQNVRKHAFSLIATRYMSRSMNSKQQEKRSEQSMENLDSFTTDLAASDNRTFAGSDPCSRLPNAGCASSPATHIAGVTRLARQKRKQTRAPKEAICRCALPWQVCFQTYARRLQPRSSNGAP